MKMFLQRRKGIKTDQMGKDKSGLPLYIEIALKVVSILVPLAELISIFMVEVNVPSYLRYVGIITGFTGVVFFVLSVTEMKDSWRAGVNKNEKTDLVTSGIYQISRNPAFVGFDLTYLGIVMIFFNTALFCLSVLAMFIFHLQIVNVEEPFLLEVFGNDYINYCKKVNRYIGRK